MTVSFDQIRCCFNRPVSMRDGVMLSADVYLPAVDKPLPTVLVRTCYTKSFGDPWGDARFWTSRGFAYVVQDVRGRGDSEGVFEPFLAEAEDGAATLDWIVDQPWSNGRVCMRGASYLGQTQLFAASARHPALAAIAPTATPDQPDRGFPILNDILCPSACFWLAFLDGRTNQDITGLDVNALLALRPLINLPAAMGRDLPVWRSWTARHDDFAYWEMRRYGLEKATTPGLHISGWYDDCLGGTLASFSALADRPDARPQRLMIGPWSHTTIGKRRVGEVDFGPHALLDIKQIECDWFEERLAGDTKGQAQAPQIRLFLMGRNRWVEPGTWPLPDTLRVILYLHSDGSANGSTGGGTLSPLHPGEQPADTYIHNPDAPVPFAASWVDLGGPDEPAATATRDDVLVYTTAPLEEPFVLCGEVRVTLFAKSNAPATDWMVKILQVGPDGTALRLSDGAVRTKLNETTDVRRYQITCWPTCVEIPTGHRLRLQIASSAQGKYQVHPGVTEVYTSPTATIAEQTVYHDTTRLSFVDLPTVSL